MFNKLVKAGFQRKRRGGGCIVWPGWEGVADVIYTLIKHRHIGLTQRYAPTPPPPCSHTSRSSPQTYPSPRHTSPTLFTRPHDRLAAIYQANFNYYIVITINFFLKILVTYRKCVCSNYGKYTNYREWVQWNILLWRFNPCILSLNNHDAKQPNAKLRRKASIFLIIT